jgi:2-keto-4-pentenoate hydratase/2-oxohepta-3-ene-1,7-dioic acid hydratase in catechol pathway
VKFVTFSVKTSLGSISHIGSLEGHRIKDLNAIYASYLRDGCNVYRWQELAQTIIPNDMLKFIEGGQLSREAANTSLAYYQQRGSPEMSQAGEKLIYQLEKVKLMAPIHRPVSIRDCSAFLEHIKHAEKGELPPAFYKYPAHYRTSTTDVIGTGDPILWPSYTEMLDYETEFAICIGKEGVNIPVEKASEYIFGYTIFNDISARDRQREEMAMRMGPAKGKCFQNSNIMGPCLVTPEEINADNLRMTAKINGELWSDGNSGTMTFKFPQIISYLSQDEPVYPGDIICSGTVGYGSGAENNKWLKPGDVIEMEVEGIGILKNKVERKLSNDIKNI